MKAELNVGLALPTGSEILDNYCFENIPFSETNLNAGIGKAWAGQTSATGLCSYLVMLFEFRSSENFGLALPIGSEMLLIFGKYQADHDL